MKASIGFRTQEEFFTGGTAGRKGFLNDHQGPASREVDSQRAPFWIQSRNALISDMERGVFPGGICNSPSRFTALYSKLASALPVTTAGPRLPPFSMVASSRTSRSDMRAAPWQATHFASRTAFAAFSTELDWADSRNVPDSRTVPSRTSTRRINAPYRAL